MAIKRNREQYGTSHCYGEITEYSVKAILERRLASKKLLGLQWLVFGENKMTSSVVFIFMDQRLI